MKPRCAWTAVPFRARASARRALVVAGRAIGLALLLLVVPARAAFDAYLSLPGIPGDATESVHLNWMQILSFQHGANSNGLHAQFSGLTLVKPVDKASPLLMTACASGRHYASARLQLVNLDGRRLVFYDLELSDVLVTALAPAGSSGGDPPLETLSLSFEAITWTYTAFTPSGVACDTARANWDLVRNQGGGALTPAFCLKGAQRNANNVTVTWNGLAGKTYRLMAGPLVQGTYTLAGQTTTTNNGPASLTLSNSAPMQFYRLEQSP